MLQSPLLGLGEEDEADLTDWNLPLAFMKKRHCEKIEGSKSLAQSWRMKDRMKTVSVALVLCLNVGVDPPDVVKTTPCARLECWIERHGRGCFVLWPDIKCYNNNTEHASAQKNSFAHLFLGRTENMDQRGESTARQAPGQRRWHLATGAAGECLQLAC